MNEVNEAEIAVEVSEASEITPEEQLIIDEVKGLMAQRETNDNIMFKKVDRKRLSVRKLSPIPLRGRLMVPTMLCTKKACATIC